VSLFDNQTPKAKSESISLSNRFHIIRKRIADIIGSWVSEISDDMRGTVYRILGKAVEHS